MEVRDSIVLIPTFSLSLKKLTNDEEGRGSLVCKGTFENGEGRNSDVLLEFCIGTPLPLPTPHTSPTLKPKILLVLRQTWGS